MDIWAREVFCACGKKRNSPPNPGKGAGHEIEKNAPVPLKPPIFNTENVFLRPLNVASGAPAHLPSLALLNKT